MPTPEESRRIFKQLFGRDPKGTEKVDPSVAYQDSLAVSRENIAQGRGTAVDSARVFMGRKPEKADKELTPAQRQKAEADSLRNYLSIMKSREEIDRAKTAGTFLKPGKPPKKGEGVLKAMSRLAGEVQKADKTIDGIIAREEEELEYPSDIKIKPVAEKIKAAKIDSLEMAENLQAQGYENFSYMIDLLSKIEVPYEEFLRMREDPGVDADPVARHMKALGWLMQETGRSIEQIQEILEATGKSQKLAPMAGFND